MDLKWLAGAMVGLLLATTCAVGTESMNGLGFRSPPVTLTAPSSSHLAFLDITHGATERSSSAPQVGGLGMSLNRAGDADCSTGFSVLTRTGQGRLLSAGHCDPTGNRRWYDRGGRLLTPGGAAVDVAPGIDSLLVDPVGGTRGYVDGGPLNDTPTQARYRLAVTGWAVPHVGDRICTSGANSGEHCGLVVRGRVLVSCVDALPGVCRAWQAEAPRGRVATVAGDSGGPVYQDKGFGNVGARGIVNSGAATVRCPATASQPYGRCFGEVFFIGIREVLRHWHVSVQVEDSGAGVLLGSIGMLASCSSLSCIRPPGGDRTPAAPAVVERPVSYNADVLARRGTEPAPQVRGCAALRRTHLGPTAGVPNPCAQARHLLRLFGHNQQALSRDGYLLQVGKLGRTGLQLVATGDVTAARRRLAADRLVESVRSVAQGP